MEENTGRELLDLIPCGGGLELSLAPPRGEDPPPVLSLLASAGAKRSFTDAVKVCSSTEVFRAEAEQQTRHSAAVPVVGWPPVRSFRRNIAGGKPQPAPAPDGLSVNSEKCGATGKGLFVKVNVDGVPIGRKVDLKACGGYENLSSAIDELFGGFLEDGGEFTLVYEDEDGDKLLVGDVPWEMFISSVKRLRVLKSCKQNQPPPSQNKEEM